MSQSETVYAMTVPRCRDESGPELTTGESPWDSQHREFDYHADEIEGHLPTGLRGALYRIGPGRLDVGAHPVGHIFDGDGMVTRIRIDESGVHCRNRYVHTREYRRSQHTSQPPRGFSTQRAGGMLANALRFPANMSNTNVLIHDRRLYSLWEGGRPYRLNPTTLETIGEENFSGALKRLGAFSAHPKSDPQTGEVFNFGLDFFPRPMIRCYRLSPQRELVTIATIPIPRLAFVHDFALTQRHLILVIDPIEVTRPIPALLGWKRVDEAVTFEPQHGTRIVLVPRRGGKPVTHTTDALFHFHINNAYDTDTHTIIDLVTHDPSNGWAGWNRHLRKYRDNPGPAFGGTLSRLTIDRQTGRISREILHDKGCEFPQLDPRRVTHEHRFSYIAAAAYAGGNPDSITTIDHQTDEHHTYTGAPGETVCEPLFAPDPSTSTEGEGWLLTLQHQPQHRRSRLLVLTASRPDRGPVAAVNLRHHVPMTFHGAFSTGLPQVRA